MRALKLIEQFVEGIEVQYAIIIFLILFFFKISNIITIGWWMVFSPILAYFAFIGGIIWFVTRGTSLHVRYNSKHKGSDNNE